MMQLGTYDAGGFQSGSEDAVSLLPYRKLKGSSQDRTLCGWGGWGMYFE